MSIYIPDSTADGTFDSTQYYTKTQVNNITSSLCSLGTVQNISADKTFQADVIFEQAAKMDDGLLTVSGHALALQDKAGTVALSSDLTPFTDIGTNTGEPHGFINRTDTTLSFDDAKLEFTITPTGADFSYYYKGTKKTKTGAQSITILDLEGLWFFYYDNETLTAVQTPWSILNHVPIAYIYWDGTNKISLNLGEERHGITMDSATHLYLHSTVGTRYASGLSLTGTTLGNGSLDTHAQVAITGGVIYDEDIQISITTPNGAALFSQDLSLPAQIPVWYRSGVSGYWRVKTANNFPVYKATSRLYYNDTSFGLTECTNNYFVASWIVATNDQRHPIICILGQRQDSSITNAETNNTLEALSFGTLPFAEMKVLYRLLFKTSNTYSNSVAASLQEILDLRTASSLPGGTYTATVHSSLAGLTDPNQHPASAISTTTTSFTNNLSASDDTVQTALNTINSFPNGLLSSASGAFRGSYVLQNSTVLGSGAFGGNLTVVGSGSFGGLYNQGYLFAAGTGSFSNLYASASGALGGSLTIGNSLATVSSSTMNYNVRNNPASAYSIDYSPTLNIYVAVTGGNIYSSTDLSTWTNRLTLTSVKSLRWYPSVSKFIGVRQNNTNPHRFVYSSNGTTWTTAAFPVLSTDYAWRNMTYSKDLNLFVAIAISAVGATDTIVKSTDGINWTTVTHPAVSNLQDVCWSSYLQKFVVIPTAVAGSETGLVSSDGTTWTTFTMPTHNSSGTKSVLSIDDNNLIVVSATKGASSYQITTSSDLVTWTSKLTGSTISGCFRMTYIREQGIIISPGEANFAFSRDRGNTWYTQVYYNISIESDVNVYRNLVVGGVLTKTLLVGAGVDIIFTGYNSAPNTNVDGLIVSAATGMFCGGGIYSVGDVFTEGNCRSMNSLVISSGSFGGLRVSGDGTVVGSGSFGGLYVSASGYVGGDFTVPQSGSFGGLYALGDSTVLGSGSFKGITVLQNADVLGSGSIGGNLTIANSGSFGGMLVKNNASVQGGVYLKTTGGTASELNYYEEASEDITFTGIWASGQTASAKFTRIGRTVILHVPSVIASSNTASSITNSAAISSRFRPATSFYGVIMATDNGSDTAGTISIIDDGSIYIGKGTSGLSGNYGGSGNAGFLGFTIAYSV
jgi:hypothetical protein